jgi:ribosomal protein S9
MARDGVAAYTQTAIRIPVEWVAELQEIAAQLSRPGIPVTQADAMRAAIAEGLIALRRDLGMPPPRLSGAPVDPETTRRPKRGSKQS